MRNNIHKIPWHIQRMMASVGTDVKRYFLLFTNNGVVGSVTYIFKENALHDLEYAHVDNKVLYYLEYGELKWSKTLEDM